MLAIPAKIGTIKPFLAGLNHTSEAESFFQAFQMDNLKISIHLHTKYNTLKHSLQMETIWIPKAQIEYTTRLT